MLYGALSVARGAWRAECNWWRMALWVSRVVSRNAEVAQRSHRGNSSVTASVRTWFGMDGDFTPQEMKDIAKDHEWCKEITYENIMEKMVEEQEADERKVRQEDQTN